VCGLIRRLPRDTSSSFFSSAKSFPAAHSEFGPYLAFYLLRHVRGL
jgi:hypothetical protein